MPQPAATLDSSSSCTARPTIVIDLNEVPVQDDSPVLVFGQGEPQELALQTQELALQNEALYSVSLCDLLLTLCSVISVHLR